LRKVATYFNVSKTEIYYYFLILIPAVVCMIVGYIKEHITSGNAYQQAVQNFLPPGKEDLYLDKRMHTKFQPDNPNGRNYLGIL
jgi:hypothetical protein